MIFALVLRFFTNFASNKCNVFSHYYVVINSCYGSTYNEMKKLIMFAKAALLVMSGAVCFSHHLSFYAHNHLPYMLYQALRDFGCIVIHIITFQPIGVSR